MPEHDGFRAAPCPHWATLAAVTRLELAPVHCEPVRLSGPASTLNRSRLSWFCGLDLPGTGRGAAGDPGLILTDVVNTADGVLPPCDVGPLVIAVMQPVLVGRGAFGLSKVGAGVDPFGGEGSVEPFDLFCR